MTHESITFYVAAIVPAFMCFLANLSVRKAAVLESSGADWLLILVAFDATCVFTLTEVAKFVPDADVKANLVAIIGTLLLGTLIFWFFVATSVEAWIKAAATKKKIALFITLWLIIVGLTSTHFLIFLYKLGEKS
ncbi:MULTISPECIES: hypothetical protein [unclassified Variovorax]|uniref:hypothetical protein n=1 Tax=unclassified Variovorax TaxID=663243 RepID=UPI003F469B3A